MSSQHFTGRDTEARVRDELGHVITNVAKNSTDPDLMYVAEQTGALLYTKAGKKCNIKRWHAFTDLGGWFGLVLAKDVNKWADEGRITEEERVHYLTNLSIVDHHPELWKLPVDHPQHPKNMGYEEKPSSGRSPKKPKLLRANKAEGQSLEVSPAKQMVKLELNDPVEDEEEIQNTIVVAPRINTAAAENSVMNPFLDRPVIRSTWLGVGPRGLATDALIHEISRNLNKLLTARELAHAVRDTIDEDLRDEFICHFANILGEMAVGDYVEPWI